MKRREMRCSRGPSPSSLLMLAQEDLALCSSKSNQSFSLRQFPIFTRSLHFPKQELPIVSSNHPSSITIYFLHFFLSIVLIVTSSSMGTKKLNITTWGAYGKMRSIGYLLKLIFLRQDEENRIPVKAYFLCTSVDLKSMQAENADNVIPPTSRLSNYVALQYCDFPPEITGLGVAKAGCCRYMVVFQYGSAVLFNIADHEVENYLEIVRKHASGLLPDMRKDDYGVVENPHLETWMQGGPDKIVLKKLDCDGVRIIGSVLGQSVALDYFVRQVDGMVEEFTDINHGMEKTGTFTMQRKKLFQLVEKANSRPMSF